MKIISVPRSSFTERPGAREEAVAAPPKPRSLRRPYITVSYAQSLDGCIASERGKRLVLSGRTSLRYIHELRASHDAILVGIGTVLSDNPRLTVRLAGGDHPQPIVIDTRLRIPDDAYLLTRHPLPPIIAAGENADRRRERKLARRGVRVIRLPLEPEGRVSLPMLLGRLHERGIRKIMVEGGAGVITSFLSHRLVDRMVVTIAPVLVGGMPVIAGSAGRRFPLPRLGRWKSKMLGDDLVIEGEPLWGKP